MDRDIPTFNQLIVNKINEKNLIRHQQRLSEIKVVYFGWRLLRDRGYTRDRRWIAGRTKKLRCWRKRRRHRLRRVIWCCLTKWGILWEEPILGISLIIIKLGSKGDIQWSLQEFKNKIAVSSIWWSNVRTYWRATPHD